jgi:hypothetical protein
MVIKQLLLGIDQTANTLVYMPGDGFGFADETLSARSWRLQQKGNKLAGLFRKVIDVLFFWDKQHCYNSFLSEVLRTHLPPDYRRTGFDIYTEKDV